MYVIPSHFLFLFFIFLFFLALRGEFQKKNASLACALAHLWLTNKTQNKLEYSQLNELNESSSFKDVPQYPIFELTDNYLEGLRNCFWPGRAQIIQKGMIC